MIKKTNARIISFIVVLMVTASASGLAMIPATTITAGNENAFLGKNMATSGVLENNLKNALDATSFGVNLTTSGAKGGLPWAVDNSTSYKYGSSARSGTCNINGESSSLTLSFYTAVVCNFSFYWEFNHTVADFFQLLIDSSLTVNCPNNAPWDFDMSSVGAGYHNLTWKLSKMQVGAPSTGHLDLFKLSRKDVYEPNNYLSTASLISNGSYPNLYLNEPDYYKLWLFQGKMLNVTINAPWPLQSYEYGLYLYYSDGTPVEGDYWKTQSNSASNSYQGLMLSAPKNDTYVLKVDINPEFYGYPYSMNVVVSTYQAPGGGSIDGFSWYVMLASAFAGVASIAAIMSRKKK